jgi:translation elongation factor EF-Tu-like GTPase
MFLRTADFAVAVTLPENVKMATPGDNLKLNLKLEFPMSIKKGIIYN